MSQVSKPAESPVQPSETTTENLVTMIDGTPRVSSLDVAARFGKQHKDVLKAIQKICANLPESFNGRNFAPVEYTDPKGEKRPCYHLTRDAFSLLAMGFTGKEALLWKVKYIEAFNAMEAALKRPASDTNIVDWIDHPLTSTERTRRWRARQRQRKALLECRQPEYCLSEVSQSRLVAQVDQKMENVPQSAYLRTRCAIWAALRRRYNIQRYDQLPEELVNDAILFLESLEPTGRGMVAVRQTDQLMLPAPQPDAMAQIAVLASNLRILLQQGQDFLAELSEVCHE